ncbi:hypothetical protein EXS70_01750 [Candidatus Peribacteria bacterium]|nr:hypothetical protein [Candidatus Peribacteria bacterium]
MSSGASSSLSTKSSASTSSISSSSSSSSTSSSSARVAVRVRFFSSCTPAALSCATREWITGSKLISKPIRNIALNTK